MCVCVDTLYIIFHHTFYSRLFLLSMLNIEPSSFIYGSLEFTGPSQNFKLSRRPYTQRSTRERKKVQKGNGKKLVLK